LPDTSWDAITFNGQVSVSHIANSQRITPLMAAAFGQITAERCIEQLPIMGTDPECEYTFGANTIAYGDAGNGSEFMAFTIIDSTITVTFEGKLIKVGDPISKVNLISKEAYDGRVPITIGPDTYYRARMNFNHSILSISFRYDPNTDLITEISLTQVLT
jgi:hypothetical protein